MASYFLHCMYGVYKRCNVGCWDAVAARHTTVEKEKFQGQLNSLRVPG